MPSPEKIVRDYWDAHLEHNPLRMGHGETDSAAFLSWMIEGAGDIIRELAKTHPDPRYIFEKVNRLKNYIDARDWRDPLDPKDKDRLYQTIKLLEGLPTPDVRTQVIKSLLGSITIRDKQGILTWLDKLRPMLPSSYKPETIPATEPPPRRNVEPGQMQYLSGGPAVAELVPATEKKEKRFTTVNSRFTVQCDKCGFLQAFLKVSEALKYAEAIAPKHAGAGEKLTIFDVMAKPGKCECWDLEANCLSRKGEVAQPAALFDKKTDLDPKILEQYPWGKVPDKINIPLTPREADIPPIKGSSEPGDVIDTPDLEPPEFNIVEIHAAETIIGLLQTALNEDDKSASLKKFKRIFEKLNQDMVDGAEDVETAIEEYEGIERSGMTPEEYNDEKQSAFEEIVEAAEAIELTEEVQEMKEAMEKNKPEGPMTGAADYIKEEKRKAEEVVEPLPPEKPMRLYFSDSAEGYGGSTESSVNFFRRKATQIGQVQKVTCDGYSLNIIGELGTISLSSCNCGYAGTGPQGTAQVLMDLGVHQERAEALMKRNTFTEWIIKEPNLSGIPLEITKQEFEKDWEPRGWNLLIIGPTAAWKGAWSEWTALRELIQNALDASESYEYGYDNMGFFIKDHGTGINDMRNFLMGPPKLKEPWERGEHGEGMKIGALSLVREGYPVFVETGVNDVIPCFFTQPISAGGETVSQLAVLWKYGQAHKGTTWHIINYKGPDFADRIAINLPLSDILANTPSQLSKPRKRFNQLIDHDFRKTAHGIDETASMSRIFVRDIFMRDIKSPFSYNLWDVELASDRNAPRSETDLWKDISRVWACIIDPALLETFMRMMITDEKGKAEIESDEQSLLNMYDMGYPADSTTTYFTTMRNNESAWKAAWDKVAGKDAVIRTDSAKDGSVKHIGYKPVGLQRSLREAVKDIIRTDTSVLMDSQDRLSEAEIVPENILSARQLASLALVRALVRDLAVGMWAGMEGKVYAAHIPAASELRSTAGLYNRITQDIFIEVTQLENAVHAVDTALHEMAHHTSQKDDAEKEHYLHISQLAGLAVQYVSQGNFDKIIKGKDFNWGY